MAQERRSNPDHRRAGGVRGAVLPGVLRVVPWTLALALAAALAIQGEEIERLLRIGAAYKAKILCSGVFVSGRSADSVLEEDLAVEDLWPLRFFPFELDRERQTVRSGIAGMFEAAARFRPGLGCVVGASPRQWEPAVEVVAKAVATPPAALDGSAGRISPHLQAALDWGFAEPDPEHLRRTRAMLVLQDGEVVAERYAPGFGPDTPLAGWSMAKTVLNALVGVLVGEGRVRLDAPLDLPEWRGDGRAAITLEQLLQMTSGLEFSEEYGSPLQDVTVMLLLHPSAAAYAAAKPLRRPPGTHWYYSSGNSNLISRLLRTVLGPERYDRFPREGLFAPLGMDTAVLEQDAAGDFVASSYLYASARDWGKLGQLFLQDGVWRGRRILPAGWVGASTQPVAGSAGAYGRHLWLRPPDSLLGPDAVELPAGSYHAVGFESQFVTVVPARRAVLVRLGLTRHAGSWRQDLWARRVLAALPQ